MQLNPVEAFVFGGAVLTHDLGLGLAAYPGGFDELRSLPEWKDLLALELGHVLSRAPSEGELEAAGQEIRDHVTQTLLRERHATQAHDLGRISWTDPEGQTYWLIEDDDLRLALGGLIGLIAHSHWWSVDEIATRVPPHFNAPPAFGDWQLTASSSPACSGWQMPRTLMPVAHRRSCELSGGRTPCPTRIGPSSKGSKYPGSWERRRYSRQRRSRPRRQVLGGSATTCSSSSTANSAAWR